MTWRRKETPDEARRASRWEEFYAPEIASIVDQVRALRAKVDSYAEAQDLPPLSNEAQSRIAAALEKLLTMALVQMIDPDPGTPGRLEACVAALEPPLGAIERRVVLLEIVRGLHREPDALYLTLFGLQQKAVSRRTFDRIVAKIASTGTGCPAPRGFYPAVAELSILIGWCGDQVRASDRRDDANSKRAMRERAINRVAAAYRRADESFPNPT